MKKKYLRLILVIVLCLGLWTACGPNRKAEPGNEEQPQETAKEETNPAEKNGDQPITIQFATWGVSEGATNETFEKMAEAFKKIHPNVSISFVGIPFGNIKQQTFVMAASGDAPDLIQTHTAWFSTYAASDIIVPVDDLLGKDYVNDLIDSYKADYSYKGKLMGIPWAPSPVILYYNKALFEKAGLDPEKSPKTYDEMLTMARKIAQLKTDSGDKIFGLGEPTDKLPINGLHSIRNVYAFGASIYDKEGKVNVNTPEMVEMLEYYQTLSEEGLTPEAAKLKDLRNLFSIGRLGMYMDGYYGRNVFRNLSGKGKAFDSVWSAALVPVNRAGQSVSVGVAHGLVISKDSQNKQAAADFAKFLTDREMITYYHSTNDVLSARKSLSDDPALNDSEFAKICVEQLNQYTRALPENHPGMEQAFLEFATALQQVTVGKEDPEKVAKDLQTKLGGLLQ